MKPSFPLFLATRLYNFKEDSKHTSSLGVNIATLGVMIGIAVMIVSVAIVFGFKNEIKNKVVGFGGDIQVVNTDLAQSSVNYPVLYSKTFLSDIKNTEGVKHVQLVTQKAGIFKTSTDFKGVMFYGVGDDFDTTFISSHIIEGRMPHFLKNVTTNEILISSTMSKELNLKTGEKVFTYFFDKEIKVRRFLVVGIYETNLSQFDNNVVYSNRLVINGLNNWIGSDCSNIEIAVDNFSENENIADRVAEVLPSKPDANGCFYSVYSIGELYSSIFDWLKLLDLNIWVILVLMSCVCCFTIVSGLLILILERTSSIGLLKSLGASTSLVRNVYVYYGMMIIGRGLVCGNILGLALCFIQYQWHLVELDSASYYVDFVPISLDWLVWLLLNVSVMVICSLVLFVPTIVVGHINPVKVLKFD